MYSGTEFKTTRQLGDQVRREQFATALLLVRGGGDWPDVFGALGDLAWLWRVFKNARDHELDAVAPDRRVLLPLETALAGSSALRSTLVSARQAACDFVGGRHYAPRDSDAVWVSQKHQLAESVRRLWREEFLHAGRRAAEVTDRDLARWAIEKAPDSPRAQIEIAGRALRAIRLDEEADCDDRARALYMYLWGRP